MNLNRFFMPEYMGMTNNFMPPRPIMGLSNNIFNNSVSRVSGNGGLSRSFGLFNKITNGIRSVNWGSFLNNANKTLNVVNQTIPLVRQAGPMVNNMKSMIKIAKVFGSETNSRFNNNRNIDNNNTDLNNSSGIIRNTNNVRNNEEYIIADDSFKNVVNEENQKKIQNNNSPNFFV